MALALEIDDKSGRPIRLTTERWSHIRQRHKDVQLGDVEQTLLKPTTVVPECDDISLFYRYFKNRRKQPRFLKVIVKYLNAHGFIITALFVKRPTRS